MARTIRTCSFVLFALAGCASAVRTQQTPLGAYMQARVLDIGGESRMAAAAYGRAMTAAPADQAIAARAYRRAIEAGDKRLALRAALSLRETSEFPPDGHLLFVVDAIERGDWAAARTEIDRIEKKTNYDFLTPALRAWTAFAVGDGDALDRLEAGGGLSSAFNRETRILLLLASGRWQDAIGGLRLLSATDGRQTSLRLAAAAQLQRLGKLEDARDVLGGAELPLAAARERLNAGQRLGDSVTTAGGGVAFLLARLSTDLSQRSNSQTALALARIASFADPESNHVRFALVRALSMAGENEAALETIAKFERPLWAQAKAARIDVLIRAGREEEALVDAEASEASADGATLLLVGDVYARAGRHADAARVFRAAIDAGGGVAGWQAWMLYGAELDASGDWQAAKAALERALKLAPDEPTVLNQLGYAMLERRDDLAQATQYIAKAHRLQPDSAAITDSLGWAFHLRGRTLEAIPLLERAAAMRPGEAEIGEHLGDAYWALGRKVEARYAWTAALVATENSADLVRIKAKVRDGLPTPR